MMRVRKNKGSAYLYVIVVFVVISTFTAFMLSGLNHTIFQMHTYSIHMKAHYLNLEAEETLVAALLQDDHDLLKNLPYPASESMSHYDNGTRIADSDFRITKERHNYYGERKEWVVARVTTTVYDERPGRVGEPFTYEGTVMILLENPIVQLYNLQPE